MTATTSPAASPVRPARRLRVPGISPPSDRSIAAALALVFVAVSVWWAFADTRPPDGDGSRHYGYAFDYYRGIFEYGHVLTPFHAWLVYPPLVHVIGAVTVAVTGLSTEWPLIVVNALFVPALVAGTYGTAQLAFGRRAGLVAAIFVIATPMAISQFHTFMLDGPLTAMVALTVWLLLASRRFAIARYALLAGIAAGLGLLVKDTFVVFPAGVVLVMLARGGWRRWKGLLAFAAPALLIAGPWYIRHFDHLRGHASGLPDTGPAVGVSWYAGVPYPSHGDLSNWTWYGWNLLNNQLYLPFTVAFVGGCAYVLYRLVRSRGREGVLAELLMGGLVSYFVASWLIIKDPRYTLPALVFVAVIAAGGLVALPRRLRIAAVTAFVAVALAQFAMTSFDVGLDKPIMATTAKSVSSPIREWSAVVASPTGYFEGAPDKGARIEQLLEAAKRDGVQRLVIGGDIADNNFFNVDQVEVPMRVVGLRWGADPGQMGPHDLYLWREQRGGVRDPRACTHFADGSNVYAVRGDPAAPFQSIDKYGLYCPLGRDR